MIHWRTPPGRQQAQVLSLNVRELAGRFDSVVISLALLPFCTDTQVEIKQRWFLADGSKESSDDDKVWFCPVIVGTDKGSAPAGFLEDKSGKIPCGGCLSGAVCAVLMNVGFIHNGHQVLP